MTGISINRKMDECICCVIKLKEGIEETTGFCQGCIDGGCYWLEIGECGK